MRNNKEDRKNAALTYVPDGQNSAPVVVERHIVRSPQPTVPLDGTDEVMSFSHYLWVLRRNRWPLLGFILFSVVATVIISKRFTPLYEATCTIDIDREMPSGVLGQEAGTSAQDSTETGQFLTTQEELIQSDAVLRPVVNRYHLMDDKHGKKSSELLSRMQNAPIKMPGLKVTRPPDTFLLQVNYRSPDPQRAADVANAVAQSYISHSFDIRFKAASQLSTFMEKQLEELKVKMERSAGDLATFEKDLDVIDPEQKTSVVSSRLLQLNTDLTAAQADRVQKEAIYNSVKGGSLEAAEASSQGEQLRMLGARLNEARERFATVQAQYGTSHPEYQKAESQVNELQRQIGALTQTIQRRVASEYEEAANREELLKSAVADAKADFDQMNARSFQYRSLKQEADTDKGLYEELIRKIKEAGINANFQSNSIRLADLARPPLYPSFPNTRLNALLALVLSTIIGIAFVFVRDAMDTRVLDTEAIRRQLSVDILGSLPAVKTQPVDLAPKGTPEALTSMDDFFNKVSLALNRNIAFREAIRTLRSSVLLSEGISHTPKSILITSSAPAEGKSTIALHLAIANSEQHRKTLLIDGDLRRPTIRIGYANQRGLSDIINDDVDWRQVVEPVYNFPNLEVLGAGQASRRVADRIGLVLNKILDEAEREYDLVIIDSPPLLGFAEPLQMASLADGVLVVVRAGRTERNAVATVLSRLRRVNANVLGIALNEVREDMSSSYYYYHTANYYQHYTEATHDS